MQIPQHAGCLLQTLQWLPPSLRHVTLAATAPAYLSGPIHLTPLPLGLPGTSQNYFIWVSLPCALSPYQAFTLFPLLGTPSLLVQNVY